MRSANEHKEDLDGVYYRELRLLEEVDTTTDLSQRKLASQLGVALGVANILVRKVAQKGYIRITRRGWKRWAYVLTPSGMARKFQLTVTYVDNILAHYRRARSLLREDLSRLPLDRDSRVAIVGTSGLAELTYLALLELGVSEIDVFASDDAPVRFLGKDARRLDEIEPARYAKLVVAVAKDTSTQRRTLSSRGADPGQIVEPFAEGFVSAAQTAAEGQEV